MKNLCFLANPISMYEKSSRGAACESLVVKYTLTALLKHNIQEMQMFSLYLTSIHGGDG
jgi:hypothetical protein